jgi:intracellular sulfur oxidation DsrE/DsrF family protein
MDRRMFHRFGLGIIAAFAPTSAEASPAEGTRSADQDHRVTIQVSSNDHETQALALANTRNFATFYKDKGEALAIEVVAFGPGYGMLQDDVSGVKPAVENLMRDFGASLSFVACQNTRKAIAKSKGVTPEEIKQIPGVKDTPSGVVRLAELQRQGWSYIKP